MGRHKGVGMPRAKKQKLDAVRDRALEQVATADAESAGPLVALEPAAALPAARAPRAADKLNEIQQRVARLEAWKAAYQHLDLQRASDVQSERPIEKNAEGLRVQWARHHSSRLLSRARRSSLPSMHNL